MAKECRACESIHEKDYTQKCPICKNTELVRVYKCKHCGVYLPWEECDVTHGNIFECEECGEHFCQQCWEKNYNRALTEEEDNLLCNDCAKEGENKNEL